MLVLSLGHTCHIWQFRKVTIELPTYGRFNHSFFRGQNCWRMQLYGHVAKLLDLGSSMDSFRLFGSFFQLLSQNCWPWQFYGHFSVYPGCWLGGMYTNLLNASSSMDDFRSQIYNCRPVAGLWTLFGPLELLTQNCWPWQFYGHFSVLLKSVHRTADHCSSMDTAT